MSQKLIPQLYDNTEIKQDMRLLLLESNKRLNTRETGFIEGEKKISRK